jgi:hypothetical protein
MSDKITRSVDKNGRVTARRNTTLKEDLRDIGRMVTGFSASSLSGRGGRERSQALDDKVTEAVNGKKR